MFKAPTLSSYYSTRPPAPELRPRRPEEAGAEREAMVRPPAPPPLPPPPPPVLRPPAGGARPREPRSGPATVNQLVPLKKYLVHNKWEVCYAAFMHS